MNILDFIKAEYVSLLAGGIGGVTTAWFTQRILNKRGTFTYYVNHNRVGMTTEDEIFGNVEVTWNKNPIPNLYLSTIVLKNESLNDYEDVIVTSYTDDTNLLTERTQIIDTPNIIEHSGNYKDKIHIPDGEQPTDIQWKIYNGQREYVIPIFNRGDSVQLTYLNAAKSDETPHIFVSVVKKGVKLKYRSPQNQVFGENQPRAAFAGMLIGIIAVIAIVYFTKEPWFIAAGAFILGLFSQVPGAYAIKALRYIRDLIGG